MIRSIAAIDSKRGIATNQGIPWDLPTDKAYYRQQIAGKPLLMGMGVYAEMKEPFPGQPNFVANPEPVALRPGFEQVQDARAYLQQAKQSNQDVWVVGGAILFESTLDLVDELYLTQIDADFKCTKFFPEFKNQYQLVSDGPEQHENGLTFRFQIWRRKP